MLIKRFLAAVFSLMSVGLLLAACDAQSEAVPVTEPGVPVTPIASSARARGKAPATTSRRGGVFVFGRGGDSVGLDPATVTDGESYRVTSQCLEPLYRYAPGTTQPIPALATACTPNGDNTEWTCHLRQDVRFHDGTDFNADAVLFNFHRWRDTLNPYHHTDQVFEYYGFMWQGFDGDSVLREVRKVDDHTVKFALDAPLAPFLANIAMDMFAISSPAAIVHYDRDYGTPAVGCVGTGPFRFVDWVEGDHITLAANDDYWGGRPAIDQIVWRVIPDDSARFLALKVGDIHAMEQATAEDVAAAEADPNLYVLTRPALNTGYLAFNFRVAEFNDIRVRKAVFHAINRQALVHTFYGKYGEVATNFLPPLMWGHNDDIEDWQYNPQLARELLAEAGYLDGLSQVTISEDILDAEGNVLYAAGTEIPLMLYYMPITRFYYPSPQQIAEAMAADLARAGIDVRLELAGDWATYLGMYRSGHLAGLYMLGWGVFNGDPDNFHSYFFGGLSSAGEIKQPDPREGFYANQEIASLLFEARNMTEQAARQEIYRRVEQLLHDDAARLWVVHNSTPLLFSDRVSGYQPQAVGADDYRWVVLEP